MKKIKDYLKKYQPKNMTNPGTGKIHPESGSQIWIRVPQGKKHRIPDTDPQHCPRQKMDIFLKIFEVI
jgi:hypothetical protein